MNEEISAVIDCYSIVCLVMLLESIEHIFARNAFASDSCRYDMPIDRLTLRNAVHH